MNALQAAIARPRATFGEEELYADIYEKAAALMESIILNHPFMDANKRTGLTAAAIFLQGNDYRLRAGSTSLQQFILEIAQGNLTRQEIAEWLRAHSVRA